MVDQINSGLDDFRDTFPEKLADRHRRIINRIWFWLPCEVCKGQLFYGACQKCDPAESWFVRRPIEVPKQNPVLNWT